MQKYLEGLTALHSAEEQAVGSRAAGRHVRREPVITEHPLVRTHPVTGWKSLFVNPGFVKQIVGVPKMESDVILEYLNNIVVATQELHARFRWEPHSVAFWDNRCCVCFPLRCIDFVTNGSDLEPLCFLRVCSSYTPCGSGHPPRRAPSFRPTREVARGGTKCYDRQTTGQQERCETVQL